MSMLPKLKDIEKQGWGKKKHILLLQMAQKDAATDPSAGALPGSWK